MSYVNWTGLIAYDTLHKIITINLRMYAETHKTMRCVWSVEKQNEQELLSMSEKSKKGLVVGLANDHSIAWGCIEAFHEQGAEMVITYLNDKTRGYTEPLVKQVNAPLFLPLDVTSEEQMDSLFEIVEQKMGKLDFLVHSIAFAPQADLHGRIVDCSLEGFQMAMDISCHSLIRLVKRAEPLMSEGGSVLTMSYYGADKVVNNYNMMGPVKAALESCVRYLAYDLGEKNIRVNALSPGPVLTRAATGIAHFDELLDKVTTNAPIHIPVSIEKIGQTAAFLVSEHAKHITGQTIYIDNGYSTLG